MQNKPVVVTGGMGVLVLIVIVAMLSPGAAVARQDSTPPPLGDFVIPTSTPGSQPEDGGMVVPSATPGGGGFVIPTSTPNSAAPPEPGLPGLFEDDLTALNLQPGDVPADFATNQEIDSFSAEEVSTSMRDAGYEEVADQFDRIIETYGWRNSIGITYTSCQPSVPISEIYSEIAQLGSVDAGRAFFEDPDVEAFFGILDYNLEPAATLHGWQATLPPEAGVCFEQETEYVLFFEYWGVFITVSMVADASTDPGLVFGLLDQLAPVITTKVDALAPSPFPPTPAAVSGPGPGAPTPKPTQASLMPTVQPTEEALVPTQATAAKATLQDIQAVMPTLAETGLPAPPFQRNNDLSGIQTPEQLAASMNEIGFTMLATATAQGAQRDGMIGIVTEIWDTGSACPETLGISLEIDVTMFEGAQGATANLNDPTIQAAWIGSGLVTNFQPRGEGVLASGTFQHNCGLVTLYNLMVPHGRFVVAASGIVYSGADEQEIIRSLEVLSGYMIQKMDQAGLQ